MNLWDLEPNRRLTAPLAVECDIGKGDWKHGIPVIRRKNKNTDKELDICEGCALFIIKGPDWENVNI